MAVAGDTIAEAERAAERAAPRETGGLLLGYGVASDLIVARMIEVEDPTSSRTSYTRREEAAQRALDEARNAESDPNVGYVGDWHSHPAALGASRQDLRQLRDTARHLRRPLGLIVIARQSTSTSTHGFVSNAGRRPKEAQVDRSDEDQDATLITMRGLFESLQHELDARLASSTSVQHPTDKGDISEDGWRQMLEAYLPRRYRVARATIVDSRGGVSNNIDVVIYDRQYSPLLFHVGDVIYLPAESVYAVFEVRPTLSKSNLEYAGRKAASVRVLHRTSIEIRHLQGTGRPEVDFQPLAGLLCLESEWSPPFGEPFHRTLEELRGSSQIDLLCILREGGARVKYTDGVEIETSDAKVSLAYFFASLVSQLQQLGTVPPIDIDAYIQAGELPDTKE